MVEVLKNGHYQTLFVAALEVRGVKDDLTDLNQEPGDM